MKARYWSTNLLRIKGLPHSVRERYLTKAGGNPYFIEEVVRSLIDEGAVVKKNGDFVVTKTIEDVVIPSDHQRPPDGENRPARRRDEEPHQDGLGDREELLLPDPCRARSRRRGHRRSACVPDGDTAHTEAEAT